MKQDNTLKTERLLLKICLYFDALSKEASINRKKNEEKNQDEITNTKGN